jgi:hypothetical protein
MYKYNRHYSYLIGAIDHYEPWPFSRISVSFINLSLHLVRLYGWRDSPSQDLYVHRTTYKHPSMSRVGLEPKVPVFSGLTPHGHCNRLL